MNQLERIVEFPDPEKEKLLSFYKKVFISYFDNIFNKETTSKLIYKIDFNQMINLEQSNFTDYLSKLISGEFRQEAEKLFPENELEQLEYILESITKTCLHGTNTSALKNIEESWLSPASRYWTNKASKLDQKLKLNNIHDNFFGWLKINSTENIFFTTNPFDAIKYAKISPEWFQCMCNYGNLERPKDTLKRDYMRSKTFIIQKYEQAIGAIELNNREAIRKKKASIPIPPTSLKVELLSLFEEAWQELGDVEPVVILTRNPSMNSYKVKTYASHLLKTYGHGLVKDAEKMEQIVSTVLADTNDERYQYDISFEYLTVIKFGKA